MTAMLLWSGGGTGARWSHVAARCRSAGPGPAREPDERCRVKAMTGAVPPIMRLKKARLKDLIHPWAELIGVGQRPFDGNNDVCEVGLEPAG